MELIRRDEAEKKIAEALKSVFADPNAAGKIILRGVSTFVNTFENKCEKCKYFYPACPAKAGEMLFGNGKGFDNVCMCARYEPVENTIERNTRR